MSREFIFTQTGEVFWDPGNDILTRIYPQSALSPSGLWVPLNTDSSGNLQVTGLILPSSDTATLTAVSASTSSVQLLASNTNRRGAIFYNNSSSACWVAFASSASNSIFTEYLESGSTYSMDSPVYLGVISAIWQSATGSMQITELT